MNTYNPNVYTRKAPLDFVNTWKPTSNSFFQAIDNILHGLDIFGLHGAMVLYGVAIKLRYNPNNSLIENSFKKYHLPVTLWKKDDEGSLLYTFIENPKDFEDFLERSKLLGTGLEVEVANKIFITKSCDKYIITISKGPESLDFHGYKSICPNSVANRERDECYKSMKNEFSIANAIDYERDRFQKELMKKGLSDNEIEECLEAFDKGATATKYAVHTYENILF